MGAMNLVEWQKLPVSLSELCINTTLRCGQSFRWRKSDAGVWSIALHNRILSLHQDDKYLYYRAIHPQPLPAAPPTPPASHPPSHPSTPANDDNDDDNTLDLINHYFNLNTNLTALYAQWASADANFAARAPKFTGVRILRQDSWEALVGFICSSNNNIARIGQMVSKLCVHYGPLVGLVKDEGAEEEGNEDEREAIAYHDFPTPDALAADGVEANLRALGFGYRAKYLHQTAQLIVSKPPGWLDSLRNPEAPVLGVAPAPAAGKWTSEGREGYRAAHEAMLELSGVGPKVADCVCLMGLGWGEAVPVDTHVWQIAQRDYRFSKSRHLSLTAQTYAAIGAKFRGLWGSEAGWAHSVLFTADLRAFAERLVKKVEVKEETVGVDVKVEAGGEEGEMEVVRKGKVLKKRIKREPDEEETVVLEVQETTRETKRRRRG